MSDIHNKDKVDKRELSLEDSKALVKQLRHELATRDTTISDLQQELEAAKHRESCGGEREQEQREKNFELFAKLVSTRLELAVVKGALESERVLTKSP